MTNLAPPLPCRRPDLVVRPFGEDGLYVVKDPRTGAYYQLGDEEHFLLTQLDGQRDAETIRAAFAERFGQALSDEELQEFLDMAEERGLLQGERQGDKETGRQGDRGTRKQGDKETQGGAIPGAAPFGLRLLYWRKSFFDPDRLFTWLAPKLWFCWTPAFLLFSAGCIVLAAGLLWANRQMLAGSILSSLRWETAVLVWLALMFVTTCHEFAHGLTCKHYGGEVHEVGFLLIFFMPCFYCNVSDAWLFREKYKRLGVTLAGGYFELFLWALAVFVWRLTTPDSLVNYVALAVALACGVQTLFNFNPLLKLDGYYLLSDWLEVPNLQQRAGDYIKGRIRWLLWGAARPEPEPRGRCLLTYGLVSWLYSLAFLCLSLVVMSHILGAWLGLLGLAAVVLLGLLSLRGLLHGFTAGEVRTMILFRHKRTVIWAFLLGGVPAALFVIPMEDRAGGPFQLRPAVRAEVRAPVAGFLQNVCCDEGDRVAPGQLLVRIEVPDLASRLAQTRAEVREVQAKLRLLEVGPRHEEIAEQRRRVERAQAWRDLAKKDLDSARQVLEADLERLDKLIAQYAAELDFAQSSFARAQGLRAKNALSEEEYLEEAKKCRVFRAQGEQAQAETRARQARGCQEAEAERARREKEWADARATLALLEAGTRPEEIEAESARLARLHAEAAYLEALQKQEPVCSRVAGVIATAHLKEKIGQYVGEGDLIAVVVESAGLEAEITLAEQDVEHVRAGQPIELKARALPFATFSAQVDRIAPVAERGDVQGSVTIYCRLSPGAVRGSGAMRGSPDGAVRGSPDPALDALRPGMSGHARIHTGQRSVGQILINRLLRYVRTEFWW
jgi:putative peptide zinc metalloprotease protein